jgi:predicted flap endonuclease-1-like 5' DNA nuclease
MSELMSDPMFYALVWAVFTVAGAVIGWSLRAGFPESQVRKILERTEQERNSLARLYTHLKHHQDLREADMKKLSMELESVRAQLDHANLMRVSYQPADRERTQKAEANAAHFAEKVAALELLAARLRTRNDELDAELKTAHEELEAWKVLYRDFQTMQQRLADFEKAARAAETERTALRHQLEYARIEVQNLQLELLNAQPTPHQQKQSAKHSAAQTDHQGGPSAPEQTEDLKVINGITPFAEQQLINLGVNSLLQISRWDDESVLAFAKALGISPGRIFQEDWVGQARHLGTSEQ